MRDLLTLFNNRLTGASFGDYKAISATTPTAKDGTPWKKINIDDITLGPIQALFTLLGATPDGNPELKDDSQILDLQRQMAQYKVTETVTVSGALTLGIFSKVFIIDTSLGDISSDLPDGVFDGQEVEIICDGTGIARVKGAGTLTNGKKSGIWDAADASGTPISNELSLKARWNSTVGRWQVVNEVTADYVIGTSKIKNTSTGFMGIDYLDTNIDTTSGSSGSICLSTTRSFLYVNVFATTPRVKTYSQIAGGASAVWAMHSYNTSATGHDQRLGGSINTLTGTNGYVSEGGY